MSVKSQFLKKLQARQPAPFINKSQADIAEFRLRMDQLHEQMNEWLVGTGLNVDKLTVSVSDLLVEDGAFSMSAIILRYENRAVRFMPIFLYGQGVAGCVEATLYTGGCITPLGRLYMRARNLSNWTYTPPEALSSSKKIFDETTFFSLILVLLS